MKLSSKAIDPLWQALCPSFYRKPFRGSTLLLPTAAGTKVRSKPNTQRRQLTTAKLYQENRLPQDNNGSRLLNDVENGSYDAYNKQSVSPPADGRLGLQDKSQFWSGNDGEEGHLDPDQSPSKSHQPQIRFWDPVKEPEDKPHDGRNLQQLMQDGSYEELRRASTVGDYPRVREVLRTLVRMRGEKPNRRMYQSLLLANTNPHHGSPAEVSRIINEMAEEGIALDSAAYHAVLKV